MLRQLNIQNLAVIESLEVEFQPGFNVLTGETGAGKSMLVEAVGLLMGDRASSDLVRTGEVPGRSPGGIRNPAGRHRGRAARGDRPGTQPCLC